MRNGSHVTASPTMCHTHISYSLGNGPEYGTHTLTHTACVCTIQLFVTPWTVAHQAPLSMGFFRQEYWSGLPCSPAGNLPNSGTEPACLTSPALAGTFFTSSSAWEALLTLHHHDVCARHGSPGGPSTCLTGVFRFPGGI